MVGHEHRGREGLRIGLAFGGGPAEPGLPGRGNAAHVGTSAVPGALAFRQGVVVEKVSSRRRSEVANPEVRVHAEFTMRRRVGILYRACGVISRHNCRSSTRAGWGILR